MKCIRCPHASRSSRSETSSSCTASTALAAVGVVAEQAEARRSRREQPSRPGRRMMRQSGRLPASVGRVNPQPASRPAADAGPRLPGSGACSERPSRDPGADNRPHSRGLRDEDHRACTLSSARRVGLRSCPSVIDPYGSRSGPTTSKVWRAARSDGEPPPCPRGRPTGGGEAPHRHSALWAPCSAISSRSFDRGPCRGSASTSQPSSQ